MKIRVTAYVNDLLPLIHRSLFVFQREIYGFKAKKIYGIISCNT